MVDMLHELFKVVRCDEAVPRQWRKGLVMFYQRG